MPFSLVGDGSVVVQVGAPADTLGAGRSRAMLFSLLTANQGKVVVVEPDASSAQRFRAAARRLRLDHVVVHNVGAWSEAAALKIRIDDSHPATNFTEGCAGVTDDELARFRSVEVQADTIDHLLGLDDVDRVDLVSITTNGAEKEILQGMTATIGRGLPYIALAVTGQGYVELMEGYGYELLSYDDRGFTFRRTSRAPGFEST